MGNFRKSIPFRVPCGQVTVRMFINYLLRKKSATKHRTDLKD